MTARSPAPPTLASLRHHRQAIHDVARRRGLTSIKVFGSVARGDARAGSDVDLLVQLEPGSSLLDLGGFVEDLSELLERPVHVVTPRTLHGPLDTKALEDATQL